MPDEVTGNGSDAAHGAEDTPQEIGLEPVAEQALEPEGGGEEGGDRDEVVAEGALLEEMDRLKAELDHLREMYLRKLAEFDNFRKRTERERREHEARAGERLVGELVPVLDNFDRALQHSQETDPVAFRRGVEMIARQLWDVLQREGMAVLDPVGEAFTPELHEAVTRVEDPAHEPGTVVQVLAKGYLLGGRLIRPAMVAVAVEPTVQAVEDAAVEDEP
jgi:molecular chaperone GrpE